MTSYPYAVGRIRGLERSFLSPQDLARMAEQPLAAAVKQLADSGYGHEAENKSDPDALVATEMKTLRSVIDELTPDKPLTDLFWLEQDAVNLKWLLKARLLHEPVTKEDLAFGLFDFELLQHSVAQKDYSAFPPVLKSRLSELEAAIGKNVGADPYAISAAVDDAIYQQIFSNKKKGFTHKFFSAKVDFTNVLSFLRSRGLGWSLEKFEMSLLKGGDLPLKQFLDAYPLSSEEIEVALPRGSVHESAIRKALAATLGENGDIASAADIFSTALLTFAASDRFDPFGIGPVVYYLHRKIDEGKRLRVLFAKKRSSEMRKGIEAAAAKA